MNLKSIDYKKDNEVANIIKINEPQFGMTLEILVEMEEALIDANNDKDISVIIISTFLLFSLQRLLLTSFLSINLSISLEVLLILYIILT